MARQMHKIAVVFGLLGSFAKASQVDVVLAHYNEDLSWITRIPDDVHVHIYTKGSKADLSVPSVSEASVQQLPNVGRESHTFLKHIVENFERLADWTVFSQAGEPSFGYKGHRSGGGHLLAGDDFANYLVPHPSGSRFVYTAVVHLPSMNHLLRASYCINDELLEGEGANVCPKDASQWTPWWDIGEFRSFVTSMVESQHGDNIMEFYRKHINPAFSGDEVMAFFPQGARFAVSKETVQRRPRAEYERLLASLSDNEDPYAGYFMEWLWSELFLGHQEPCPVPPMLTAVSHAEAMNSLVQNFPKSVQRQLSAAGAVDCICVDISGGVHGGISGGVSGGISGGVSGGISSSISGAVSGGISSGVSGSISGAISGDISSTSCSCPGVSGGISMGLSGGISGGVSGDISGGLSGGISGGISVTTPVVSSTTRSTTTAKASTSSSSGTSTASSTSTFLSTSSFASTLIKSTTSAPPAPQATTNSSNVTNMTNATSTTNVTNITDITNMTNVTRVAGVFEVEIYVEGNISKEAVQDMFTRALAAALEVPMHLVASLTASEINQTSGSQRRLLVNGTNQTVNGTNQTSFRDIHTKLYEVAYEIVVPDHMDANDIIAKANRIAEQGSAESHEFRQVLLSTDGVVGVGKIVSKVPAYKKLPHTVPPSTPEDEDRSWVSVLIGIGAFILVISCLVTTFILVRRRMASTGASKASANQEFHSIP